MWIANAATVRLRRWDAGTRTFVPPSGRRLWDPVRERVRAEHRKFAQKHEGNPIRPSELFGPDGASLVMPVSPMAPVEPDGSPGRLTHVFGFTIVLLDLPVIERQVLPSLVSRYFGTPRTSDYHVAVLERHGARTGRIRGGAR